MPIELTYKLWVALTHIFLYRSTPRHDSFYGGTSDLTGSLAWEEDGKTFVMFRRKMAGSANGDHPFKDKLHFVWAHGQTGDDFYAADELKYHSGNRGSSIIREFVFI